MLHKYNVEGIKADLYLLIIYNAWSDFRSLIAWCAFHPQHSLTEGLSRNAVVRQFNVNPIPLLEEPSQRDERDTAGCTSLSWYRLMNMKNIYRPPETIREYCLIWGHRKLCSFYEGMQVLLQSDRLLWRLTCDPGEYNWNLQKWNRSSWFRDRDVKIEFSCEITWRAFCFALFLQNSVEATQGG